ncbi:MAG: response regulator [Lautropia sp.]
MSARPVLRVVAAGLQDRDLRLVRILFTHNAHNAFDYRLVPAPGDPASLSTPLDEGEAQVLLVDPDTPAGARALAEVSDAGAPLPAIHVLRAGAVSQAPWRVAAAELAQGLLPRLNRLVEAEGIDRPAVAAALPPAPARSARFGLRSGRERHADAQSRADSPRAVAVRAVGETGTPASRREVGADVAVLDRPPPGLDAGADVDEDIDRIGAATTIDTADAQALIAEARIAALNARIAVARGVSSARGGRAPTPDGTASSLLSARARADRADLPLAGRCVLVADPAVISQRRVAKLFESFGADVRCVVGAVAAADLARRERIDLVVTESTLLDTGAVAMIRRLRRVPGCGSIPVLLLAARASVPLRLVARALGGVTCVARSIDADALRALAERVSKPSG